MPSGWTLTRLLAAAGLARRMPDPSAVEPPVRTVADLPPGLTAAQRRQALHPLRGGRTGRLRLGAVHLTQTSPVTCGAAVTVLLAAAGDPALALWLATGQRTARRPPELAGLTRAQIGEPDAGERWALAQRAAHAHVRSGAVLGFDWPERFGSPPWAVARRARFRGVEFSHTPVHDRDAARTRAVLLAVRAATGSGIPIPLYTGGSTASGLAAAAPRHVVLALPASGAAPDELRLYEPGHGQVHSVRVETLIARQGPSAALGGWSHVVWAVLPASMLG